MGDPNSARSPPLSEADATGRLLARGRVLALSQTAAMTFCAASFQSGKTRLGSRSGVLCSGAELCAYGEAGRLPNRQPEQETEASTPWFAEVQRRSSRWDQRNDRRLAKTFRKGPSSDHDPLNLRRGFV